jgi:hypothetical protein
MPGFPSQYSKELWQQARDLVAAGMTFPEVSQRTGIGLDNLYKKAQREDWFVPVTALAEAREVIAQAQAAKQDNGQEVSTSVQTGVEMAESVAEMGQKGQFAVLRGLLPKIIETFGEKSALMQKEITGWKDASSAFGMFAKASGLDKPQQAVQINMWGQASGTVSGPDIPLDCTEVPQDEP